MDHEGGIMMRRVLVAVTLLGVMAACGAGETTDGGEIPTSTTTSQEPAPTTTPEEPGSDTTGGGDDAAPTGVDTSSVDACTLLTDEEVASILEGPADGSEEDLGWDAACLWEIVDDDGFLTALTVELAELGEFAEEELQNWREITTVIEESVPIGDEAFLALNGIEGSSIVIRDGTLLVFVSTTAAGHEETIKGLGSTVLERLG